MRKHNEAAFCFCSSLDLESNLFASQSLLAALRPRILLSLAPGSADVLIGSSPAASKKFRSRSSLLQVPLTFELRLLQFSGDHTARVTPVPIPNTVVKPRRADDTARVTVWERRSSPGLNCKTAPTHTFEPGPFSFWSRHPRVGPSPVSRRPTPRANSQTTAPST